MAALEGFTHKEAAPYRWTVMLFQSGLNNEWLLQWRWAGEESEHLTLPPEHVRFTCPLCGIFVSICIINFHNSNRFIRTMLENFSQINKIRPPPNCKCRCVRIYAGGMVARLSGGSNFALFRAALEKDRFGGRSRTEALVIHHFCRASRPFAVNWRSYLGRNENIFARFSNKK